MECPMCFDLYNAQTKIPRNMQCGHTACQECLEVFYEKKKILECPSCRFRHDPQIRPSFLSKNFIVLQLACQRHELRSKHQFCPTHDEPLKFFCSTDSTYICVECIPQHTGHHFLKQDASFFAAKKRLSSQGTRLQSLKQMLQKQQKDLVYVKSEVVASHAQAVDELTNKFKVLKDALLREEQRCRNQLDEYLQGVLADIGTQESQVANELAANAQRRSRAEAFLQKLQSTRQAQDDYSLQDEQRPRTHSKTSIAQFPALVMPFSGEESFVQVCHKLSPKICFFGERKKLFTLCPITGAYSLTTLSNYQVHYYAAACTLPTGEVLITGGGSSNGCYLFSPRQPHGLEKRKPMHNARKEHSCVCLGTRVYAISGYDGKSKGMAGCQAYDLFCDEWRIVSSLNVPRCAFAAVASAHRIYVFGGYDGKQRLNSIEVYNPQTDKWTLLSTVLPFPLSNAAAVSEGRAIFVLGGGWAQGFNHEVFQFNIDSHQITYCQKMQKGRDLRNKAVKYRHQVFTVGGNFFDGDLFDLRRGEWSDLREYNDLAHDNLDSWCCALAYSPHEHEMLKYHQMTRLLHRKRDQQEY